MKKIVLSIIVCITLTTSCKKDKEEARLKQELIQWGPWLEINTNVVNEYLIWKWTDNYLIVKDSVDYLDENGNIENSEVISIDTTTYQMINSGSFSLSTNQGTQVYKVDSISQSQLTLTPITPYPYGITFTYIPFRP